MNYKLAKQLKDAGFPQELHTHFYETKDCIDIRIPILSELI